MKVNRKSKFKLFSLLFLSMLFIGAQWQLEMADIFILTWEDPDAFNWIFAQWTMNAWIARDFFMVLMDLCWLGMLVICLSMLDRHKRPIIVVQAKKEWFLNEDPKAKT